MLLNWQIYVLIHTENGFQYEFPEKIPVLHNDKCRNHGITPVPYADIVGFSASKAHIPVVVTFKHFRKDFFDEFDFGVCFPQKKGIAEPL